MTAAERTMSVVVQDTVAAIGRLVDGKARGRIVIAQDAIR
jgi:hypothetical protein